MTTWAGLLAEIRADLQDTAIAPSTPKWSDQMLYLYSKDAIRDYSTWFPKRQDRVEISPTGDAYPLPNDFIEDITVEQPIDTYLVRRPNRPGSQYQVTTLAHFYTVQGGNIYLSSLPVEPLYLSYFCTHPVPTSETDTSAVITVPDVDIELIRVYVKAKVYAQMRGRQSALDRFKVAGKRDDNPLEPEVGDLMENYRRKVAERLPGGEITLHLVGRSR